MSGTQELTVREKRELADKEEKTIPGRYLVPSADIFETNEALTVIMEMPGVEKNKLSIALENDVLRVDGQINFSNYEGMEPVYTGTTLDTTHAGSRSPARSTGTGSARSLMMAC